MIKVFGLILGALCILYIGLFIGVQVCKYKYGIKPDGEKTDEFIDEVDEDGFDGAF